MGGDNNYASNGRPVIARSTSGGGAGSFEIVWSDPGITGNYCSVKALLPDRATAIVAYAATTAWSQYPAHQGVLRSGDGGASWTYILTGTNATLLAQDAADNQVVYKGNTPALGCSGSDVWRTEDGGSIWTPITAGLPADFVVQALVASPTEADLLFVGGGACYGGEPYRLYYSGDRGDAWEDRSGGLPEYGGEKITITALLMP